MPILKTELLQGQGVSYASDYTQQISDNLDTLLVPMNQIRTIYGNPMIVNSGWRPPVVNKACGGAPNSKHLQGLACDISDRDGSLWTWVLLHLDLMQELKIYLENKCYTATWVHFQLGGPASGRRIFIPNNSIPPDPKAWNGQYSAVYNGDID
jgi:hypothetical protein